MSFKEKFGTTEARYKLANTMVNQFNIALAAVAWRGYEKYGRGYVLVLPKYVNNNLTLGNINYSKLDNAIID